jgi:hypothetical protein
MVQRAGLACVGVLVVIGTVGCGGGGSHQYSLSATRLCLKKAGLPTSVVTNSFLPSAGGDLRARLTNAGPSLLAPANLRGGPPPNQQYVFLIFGRDAAAALATKKKALALALRSLRADGLLMTRAAVEDSVGLAENVFYYSTTGALTKSERAKVTSCLR